MNQFNEIRREIAARALNNSNPYNLGGLKPSDIALLEETHAVLIARDHVTREENDERWTQYSQEDHFKSNFEVMDEDIGAEATSFIKREMVDWTRARKENVAVQLVTQMMTNRDNDQPELLERDADLLIQSLDDTNMEEVMVNAAADAEFKEWQKSVYEPSIACQLIKDKWAGTHNSQEKILQEIQGPKKVLTYMQHLGCWLTFVYKDLGAVEDGNLLFTSYHDNRFNTTTCRNAAGMIMAAMAIPDLLGMTSEESECNAVIEPGTCPFYLEARFLKQHDGWAHYWSNFFSDQAGDEPYIAEKKIRRCQLFNLISIDTVTGQKEEVMRKITTPWSHRQQLSGGTAQGGMGSSEKKKQSEYPAFKLFTMLCKHLGLEVISTRGDRPEWKGMCTDGTKRPGFRIQVKKEDFALMLLMNKSYTERIKGMLSELVNSDNLSQHGKDFVRDAVEKYHSTLDHMTQGEDPDSDALVRIHVNERPIPPEKARMLRVNLSYPYPADEIPVCVERRREMTRLDNLIQREDEQDQQDEEDQDGQERQPDQSSNRAGAATQARARYSEAMDEGETEWIDNEPMTPRSERSAGTLDTGVTGVTRGTTTSGLTRVTENVSGRRFTLTSQKRPRKEEEW